MHAIHLTVLGVEVDVASLADVIRSKEAAGREKDRLVLPVLRRILDEGGHRISGSNYLSDAHARPPVRRSWPGRRGISGQATQRLASTSRIIELTLPTALGL